MVDSNNGKKKNFLLGIYETKYKLLMIISILMLLFSFGVIIFQVATTGDFVSKGITLKGGLTLTVDTDAPVNPDELQALLRQRYSQADVNVRSLGELGSYGYVVEASDLSEEELVSVLKTKFPDLTESQYSSEITGPSLGSAFCADIKGNICCILIYEFSRLSIFWTFIKIEVVNIISFNNSRYYYVLCRLCYYVYYPDSYTDWFNCNIF